MIMHEAIKLFYEKTNHPEKLVDIPETQIQKMIEQEMRDIKNLKLAKYKNNSELLIIAVNRIIDWFNDKKIIPSLNIEWLRDFISSHRITYVWAVILRKEIDDKKEEKRLTESISKAPKMPPMSPKWRR